MASKAVSHAVKFVHGAIREQTIAQYKARKAIVKPVAPLSLAEFVKESWETLEPETELIWNWHIDAICEHVQETLLDWLKHKQDQTYQQRIQNLLVNVPPGSLKSRVVSVCTPAWFWTIHPAWRSMFFSANPRVALRDSVYCRDVIESEWYQQRFRPDWQLREDNNSKSVFWNTKGGLRTALGWNSRVTGARADCLFIDDPLDAEEANSDTIRRGVNDRWDSAIRNRVNDLRSSNRIGIMQRLHHEDWSGHILQQGGWEHLCIPQEFEPGQATTALGWADPRSEEGQLMFPERFPADVLKAEKAALGSYGYAGQHQQRPSPLTGGILKRDWWRYWQALPPETELKQWVISVDATFKDTKTSDYVVMQVWAKAGSGYYLVHEVRDRMSFTATITALKNLSRQFPRATAKLIEDKANGSAILDTLKREMTGLIAITPKESKVARAQAVSPLIEAGNIYLPRDAAWLGDFIEEMAAFPNGAHDDRVDCLSQSLNYMQAKSPNWMKSMV